MNKMKDITNNKYTEKVAYKGVLRIVGQIVNKIDDKEPVGYMIFVEKTFKIMACNIVQTVAMMKKYKFSNAELANGDKITCIENAISRLPKYNTKAVALEPNKFIILGKIFVDGVDKGYRLLNTSGKIVSLQTADIIKLVTEKNGEVVNGKIIEGRYISAIKGEFPKIERTKAQQMIDEHKLSSKESIRWRNTKFREKVEKILHDNACNCSLHGNKRRAYINTQYKQNGLKIYPGLNVDLETFIKVIVKEVLPKYSTEENINKALKLYDAYNRSSRSGYIPLIIFSQLLCKDENIIKESTLNFKRYFINNVKGRRRLSFVQNNIKELKTLNIDGCLDHILDLVDGIKYESTDSKDFNYGQLNKPNQMLALGYSIEDTNYTCRDVGVNRKYQTVVIERMLPYTDEFTNIAHHLGDLLIPANVYQMLNKFWVDCDSTEKEEQYEIKAEVMMAVLACYNAGVVEKFKEKFEKDFPFLEYILPSIDDIDYNLDDSIKMYYMSGGNLAYNDKGELINIKSKYGLDIAVDFSSIIDDLASTVGMITSSRVSQADVDTYIGLIRNAVIFD